MNIGLLSAATGWENLLWWLQVVPMVAIGLGAVIFVHELGHFLVAKACGVKCEKFMIGFDIGGYKLARRWGETLYGIGILPLGGYVKMLGQDDDPAHIAEQMKKSQIDAESANAVPIKGPDGETYYVDGRSYLAKSVPQRMSIISAGVIMNIIFAFIFAVIAYGMGVKYMPSILSETVPGSPAWVAALEPGDEFLFLGDRPDPTFLQLMGGVTLGDTQNGIPSEIRRAATSEVEELTLTPKQQPGQLAMIGITSPRTLVLLASNPTLDHSAASDARLVAPPASELRGGEPKLQGGDRIVRLGDTSVSDYRGLSAVLAQHPDQMLKIEVQRPVDPKAKVDAILDGRTETTALEFEVPPQRLRDFGLVMTMGPITAIQRNSPAMTAGFKEGDVIETVDGKKAGEAGAWTPDTLPDRMRQAAEQQREVEFVVLRQANGSPAAERVTLKVRPRVPIMYYSGTTMGGPQGVEALGIAYQIGNEVAAVLPGGPAAGKFEAGDRIAHAKIIFPAVKNTGTEEETPNIEVRFMPPKPGWLGQFVAWLFGSEINLTPEPNWPALVHSVQFVPDGTEVEFTVQRGDQATSRVTVKPAFVEDAYVAARGFIFEPIKRTRIANSFAEQLRFGFDETVDALTMVVRFLKKLGTQVPATMLGGPGTIAAAAGHHASEGIASLLIFLTMLSANLAVVNFLPIPLLDGGHMVFLAYEGIRGRPANERVVVALHTAGFVFIIGLMLFVIGLDIQRWIFT